MKTLPVGTTIQELKTTKIEAPTSTFPAFCFKLVLGERLTCSSKVNSLSGVQGEVGLCFMKSLKLLDLCKVSCKTQKGHEEKAQTAEAQTQNKAPDKRLLVHNGCCSVI